MLSVISLDSEAIGWSVLTTHVHTHMLLKFTRVVELLYLRKRNLCFVETVEMPASLVGPWKFS